MPGGDVAPISVHLRISCEAGMPRNPRLSLAPGCPCCSLRHRRRWASALRGHSGGYPTRCRTIIQSCPRPHRGVSCRPSPLRLHGHPSCCCKPPGVTPPLLPVGSPHSTEHHRLRHRRRFIPSTAPIRPQLDSEAKIGMLSERNICINLGELAQESPTARLYRTAFSDACCMRGRGTWSPGGRSHPLLPRPSPPCIAVLRLGDGHTSGCHDTAPHDGYPPPHRQPSSQSRMLRPPPPPPPRRAGSGLLLPSILPQVPDRVS